MKHRLLCILIAILTVLSLAGCNGQDDSDTGQDSQEKSTPGEASTPSSNSLSGGLPSILLNASWPKDAAPAELPEYTAGTVTASGEEDGVLHIKIKDTDKTELSTYLDTLKNAGWIVTSDDTEAEAVLGMYTVSFDLQSDGTVLQISIYTAETGKWPAGEIPPDIIPPKTGVLVEKIDILEVTQDVWYFNYTYDGVDEAAVIEYMEMLRESGWDGDDYMVSKSFEWNGKTYGASVEIYETLETRSTFTCNFWLEG